MSVYDEIYADNLLKEAVKWKLQHQHSDSVGDKPKQTAVQTRDHDDVINAHYARQLFLQRLESNAIEEERIRNEFPAVKDAFEMYQSLLILAKSTNT